MSSYDSFAEVYDRLTENVGYAERAEYITELLKMNGVCGGLLLDVACGTGTLSKYLAEAGYDVICTDNSPAMLNIARQKLPDSLILCQSMTELDLYGTVDCAVCSLDSINHLTRIADVRKAFDRISLFMNPKGVFVFDVNTQYKHREILGNNTFVYDTDGVYCVWQNSYRKKADTADIRLDIFIEENGTWSRHCEDFSERAYPAADIVQWLEYSGFEVTGIYDELTFDKPTDTTQRIYFTAIKKQGDNL